MNIRIQSVNFKADQKLLEFTENRLNKLSRFFDRIERIEVIMKADKPSIMDNKNVEVKIAVPGDDIVIKKKSNTFEDAVNQIIPVAKTTLVKHKEKLRNQ